MTDDQRHQLHTTLEHVLGRQEAATLMAHLPPVGWADVATKRDLEHLETRIDAKLERELRQLEHRFLGWMAAFFTVFVTLQTAVLQLLG